MNTGAQQGAAGHTRRRYRAGTTGTGEAQAARMQVSFHAANAILLHEVARFRAIYAATWARAGHGCRRIISIMPRRPRMLALMISTRRQLTVPRKFSILRARYRRDFRA